MISVEVLVTKLSGLQRQDLDRWICNDWVRPEGDFGHYRFREIDVARVRLIRDLRDDMKLNEDALPVVLSLLDQLYDARRQMHDLNEALHEIASEDLRRNLAAYLSARTP